jgi:hypothetical protein
MEGSMEGKSPRLKVTLRERGRGGEEGGEEGRGREGQEV